MTSAKIAYSVGSQITKDVKGFCDTSDTLAEGVRHMVTKLAKAERDAMEFMIKTHQKEMLTQIEKLMAKELGIEVSQLNEGDRNRLYNSVIINMAADLHSSTMKACSQAIFNSLSETLDGVLESLNEQQITGRIKEAAKKDVQEFIGSL